MGVDGMGFAVLSGGFLVDRKVVGRQMCSRVLTPVRRRGSCVTCGLDDFEVDPKGGGLSELESLVSGEWDVGDDKLQEECGVFGVWGVDSAARACYYGIHALQHRGQEGAGITSSDGTRLRECKGLGLVSEVFNDDNLKTVPGSAAIAHNRLGLLNFV